MGTPGPEAAFAAGAHRQRISRKNEANRISAVRDRTGRVNLLKVVFITPPRSGSLRFLPNEYHLKRLITPGRSYGLQEQRCCYCTVTLM
jgi:hypothetical protein